MFDVCRIGQLFWKCYYKRGTKQNQWEEADYNKLT